MLHLSIPWSCLCFFGSSVPVVDELVLNVSSYYSGRSLMISLRKVIEDSSLTAGIDLGSCPCARVYVRTWLSPKPQEARSRSHSYSTNAKICRHTWAWWSTDRGHGILGLKHHKAMFIIFSVVVAGDDQKEIRPRHSFRETAACPI